MLNKVKKLGKTPGYAELLKHKVKAKEKNHLTYKKSTLDTMSQCRIPFFGFETKKAIIINLFKNTKL